MSHTLPADVRFSASELDRYAASRDLWPGGTLDFWQGRPAPLPDRVCWPEDEDQVERVLAYASAHRIPVVPYGAGSGVCGGARGHTGSLVLDTKCLGALGPLDEERWTVWADAGVNGQQLEDWLGARGFTLGHSPSSIGCSTVGGWAAARSAGQFSSKYGVFEDMVLAVRAVSPSRGAFQVGAGGDAPDGWMPLILGSEGTLAVVTRVQMRVWPTPERRWLRGYRFESVASALEAMRQLMQQELWPAVVRLYDPVDTRIGGKTKAKGRAHESTEAQNFLKSWLKRVDGLTPARRRSLALPLALPGVVNRIFDQLASGCLLIAGWEGAGPVVDALSSAGHALLCRGGEDLGAEPGERWFASRHAVSYKLMPIFERGGFADTMEVAARWSLLEGVYEAVRDAVSPTAVVMAHMSHVYPEGGCIYFSFAGRGAPEVYQRTWRRAQRAVLEAGGTLTHHHGVGTLKAEYASREVGAAVAGWRALKEELDPEGVLNPGRLYQDVGDADANPVAALAASDGLARAPTGADLGARRAAVAEGSPMWPWEQLPAPPRWQRPPWQVGWIEVSGELGGSRVVLGRGPRSASGPDLRAWLAERTETLATYAVAPAGPRWMGAGRPADPWTVARDLLRGDLRPAVLTVEDGTLRVGFRGPAAAALGRVASALVPGGLSEVEWVDVALPSGPLVPSELDAPDIVAVTPQGGWSRGGS